MDFCHETSFVSETSRWDFVKMLLDLAATRMFKPAARPADVCKQIWHHQNILSFPTVRVCFQPLQLTVCQYCIMHSINELIRNLCHNIMYFTTLLFAFLDQYLPTVCLGYLFVRAPDVKQRHSKIPKLVINRQWVKWLLSFSVSPQDINLIN